MAIDMNNLPGNSYREKQSNEKTEKRVKEKAISGKAKTTKKNIFEKALGLFIEEDLHTVKNYVVTEVIIPNVKNSIVDAITSGVERLFNGESGGRRTSNGSGVLKTSLINYNKISNGSKARAVSGRTRDFEELTFETRGDAEAVLNQMQELIETYHNASIADMYDLAGLTSEYTDNNYGWTNLAKAYTERGNGGYILKLPKAEPLK